LGLDKRSEENDERAVKKKQKITTDVVVKCLRINIEKF